MAIVSSRARTRKPERLRGYRITGLTKTYAHIDSGLLWLSSPPLQMWEGIISDANTYCATLLQSGRTLLKHEPWRKQMLQASLNGNRSFSLLRTEVQA